MMLMAQATDLIMVFLALELLSIPLYVLSAISRQVNSEESGVKYFVLGAFAQRISVKSEEMEGKAVLNTRNNATKPAIFAPAAMKAVTDVGAP